MQENKLDRHVQGSQILYTSTQKSLRYKCEPFVIKFKNVSNVTYNSTINYNY